MTTLITPAERAEIEAAVIAAVDRDSPMLIAISREIHQNPELQYKEFKAAALLTSHLERRGFEVDRAAADIETAFVATAPSKASVGQPTIAILAEYDALAGLGHACGHNLIGTAALGAGLALREVSDRLPGRVQVIGCPAEEGGGGKVLLTNRGVFDEVSAAMMFHPLDSSGIHAESLAATTIEIHMHGKPAHAAANPEDGVNALDAIIQTYNGINALRQHLRSDTRIHGIITNGGQAPNIVPKYASAKFRVRAADRKYADETLAKLQRCAEGAAMAAGAKVEFNIIEESRYDNMISNGTMEGLFADTLDRLGIPWQEMKESGLGSTDMGNVSQKVPSIHPYLKIALKGVSPHTDAFREAAISDEGQRAMLNAAKAMALTAVGLLLDPDKLAAAQAEFSRAQADDKN